MELYKIFFSVASLLAAYATPRKRFQADVMDCFITELMTLDASLPVQYSDRLWLNLIDRVTVYEDGSMVFRFKNGAEITEMM